MTISVNGLSLMLTPRLERGISKTPDLAVYCFHEAHVKQSGSEFEEKVFPKPFLSNHKAKQAKPKNSQRLNFDC